MLAAQPLRWQHSHSSHYAGSTAIPAITLAAQPFQPLRWQHSHSSHYTGSTAITLAAQPLRWQHSHYTANTLAAQPLQTLHTIQPLWGWGAFILMCTK
jgi:hypothetical protein